MTVWRLTTTKTRERLGSLPRGWRARYPDLGQRHLVSTIGGNEPVWSRDGATIYFRNGNGVFGVDIDTEAGFRAGQPELMFEGPYFLDFPGSGSRNYDVAPDGRFFVIEHGLRDAGAINALHSSVRRARSAAQRGYRRRWRRGQFHFGRSRRCGGRFGAGAGNPRDAQRPGP